MNKRNAPFESVFRTAMLSFSCILMCACHAAANRVFSLDQPLGTPEVTELLALRFAIPGHADTYFETLRNKSPRTEGFGGGALDFDERDFDRLSTVGIPAGVRIYGVSFWIRTRDPDAHLVDMKGADYLDVFLESGKPVFAYTKWQGEVRVAAETRIDDGRWHHLAFVLEGYTAGRIYLDGQSDGFSPGGVTGGQGVDLSGRALIGLELTGQMDEIVIHLHAEPSSDSIKETVGKADKSVLNQAAPLSLFSIGKKIPSKRQRTMGHERFIHVSGVVAGVGGTGAGRHVDGRWVSPAEGPASGVAFSRYQGFTVEKEFGR